MSSPKLKIFFAFLLISSLSACGYRPIYSQSGTNNVREEIFSVWIDEVPDRSGQLLTNELLTLFNPKGRPTSPKYRLHSSYSENKSGLGVAKDEFSTRSNLNINSNFSLVQIDTGETVFNGRSTVVVSYNTLTSLSGSHYAKHDAQLRGIKDLAADIRTKVSSFFANESAKGSTK